MYVSTFYFELNKTKTKNLCLWCVRKPQLSISQDDIIQVIKKNCIIFNIPKNVINFAVQGTSCYRYVSWSGLCKNTTFTQCEKICVCVHSKHFFLCNFSLMNFLQSLHNNIEMQKRFPKAKRRHWIVGRKKNKTFFFNIKLLLILKTENLYKKKIPKKIIYSL